MAKPEKIRIIREIESELKEIKSKNQEQENTEEEETEEADISTEKFTEFISQKSSDSPNITPTLQSSDQTQEKPDLESDVASTPATKQNNENAPNYSATSYEAKYGADYTQADYSQENQIAHQNQIQRIRDENTAMLRENVATSTELRGIRQSTQTLPDDQMRAAQQQTRTRNLADYTSRIENEEKRRLPFERRRRSI